MLRLPRRPGGSLELLQFFLWKGRYLGIPTASSFLSRMITKPLLSPYPLVFTCQRSSSYGFIGGSVRCVELGSLVA